MATIDANIIFMPNFQGLRISRNSDLEAIFWGFRFSHFPLIVSVRGKNRKKRLYSHQENIFSYKMSHHTPLCDLRSPVKRGICDDNWSRRSRSLLQFSMFSAAYRQTGARYAYHHKETFCSSPRGEKLRWTFTPPTPLGDARRPVFPQNGESWGTAKRCEIEVS